MKLSIVIPVFNEEASIRALIERCLEFKQTTNTSSILIDVEIIVVSDGSTDKTVEYAQQFGNKIKLLIFEANRGYGAAIKHGWEHSSGDILGFLDGDGTCDPYFFDELTKNLIENDVDIALGSRLNKSSKMPFVRRIGNRFFSLMLSAMSAQKISDTASGMRVVRRSSLKKILPLPNGLHFTPAMSARAALSHELKISELEMPYAERQGESKLNVVKDSWRFLDTILKTVALYKPHLFLNWSGILSLLLGVILIFGPAIHYLNYVEVEEWMIYRFVTCNLLVLCSALFFSASFLIEKIISFTISKSTTDARGNRLIRYLFDRKTLIIVIPLLLLTGYLLIQHSLYERILTGHTQEHWSRFIAMSTLVGPALILTITKIVDYFLNLIIDYLNFLRNQ